MRRAEENRTVGRGIPGQEPSAQSPRVFWELGDMQGGPRHRGMTRTVGGAERRPMGHTQGIWGLRCHITPGLPTEGRCG